LIAYFRGKAENINKGISLIANERIILAYMKLEEKLKYGFISGLIHSNSYARVHLLFIQLIQIVVKYKLNEVDEEILVSWIIAFIALLV